MVLVLEVPATGTLRLVESEVALEVGAVRVQPLATDKLSILEVSDVLLSSLCEDVSALSIFLSTAPVTRVDIFIQVGHDALAVPLSRGPVPVIFTHLRIHLFADSILLVVRPRALVSNGICIFSAYCRISVVSFTMTNL